MRKGILVTIFVFLSMGLFAEWISVNPSDSLFSLTSFRGAVTEVAFSLDGYASQTFRDVIIQDDLTTNIDTTLEEEISLTAPHNLSATAITNDVALSWSMATIRSAAPDLAASSQINAHTSRGMAMTPGKIRLPAASFFIG
ncbi:MAG: hypothetical protein J7K89_01280 [Candidatus Cloacimonetes bacterium]|nr:hypothetical protein [Candidatus Cloacimonadota bacterium]